MTSSTLNKICNFILDNVKKYKKPLKKFLLMFVSLGDMKKVKRRQLRKRIMQCGLIKGNKVLKRDGSTIYTIEALFALFRIRYKVHILVTQSKVMKIHLDVVFQ